MAPSTTTTTSSAARPKRAGEEFARSVEGGGGGGSANKKPRFDARNPSTLAADAPEEDLILDADVIGKGGPATKRNAVNIDGYESDSDPDNFDARAAERVRRKGDDDYEGPRVSKDEEEDDMFADMEEAVQGTADGDWDEDVAREGKAGKKKKDVRFLDPREIEGQVMNSESGGHVSSQLLLRDPKGKRHAARTEEEEEEGSSETSSGEEEDRDQLPDEMEEELAAEVGAGGKKRHAPRLDAFNLRQEEEEGRYDEAGNYVRKAADPDAGNDNWLDGLSRRDLRRAREAQRTRDADRRRAAADDDALLTSDLLATLIRHLHAGETPLEALQRLNRGRGATEKKKKKKVPKWKREKQRRREADADAMDDGGDDDDDNENGNDDGTPAVDPAETARRAAVEALTGAADALYSRSHHDIYDTERELLTRQYRGETGREWRPSADEGEGKEGEDAGSGEPATATATATWEYRWVGGERHGPYDGATMKAWADAGYFGEGVEFRRAGGGEQWSRALDV